MKLTIENIETIEGIRDRVGLIQIRNVHVKPTEYQILFYNEHYSGNWEVVIYRYKENVGDSYDVDFTNIDTSGNWEKYTIVNYQMKDVETFFDYLNNTCHDFDIIHNK